MIFLCFRRKPVWRKNKNKKITGVKIPTAASKYFLNVIIPPELAQCWWYCTEVQSSLAKSLLSDAMCSVKTKFLLIQGQTNSINIYLLLTRPESASKV